MKEIIVCVIIGKLTQMDILSEQSGGNRHLKVTAFSNLLHSGEPCCRREIDVSIRSFVSDHRRLHLYGFVTYADTIARKHGLVKERDVVYIFTNFVGGNDASVFHDKHAVWCCRCHCLHGGAEKHGKKKEEYFPHISSIRLLILQR